MKKMVLFWQLSSNNKLLGTEESGGLPLRQNWLEARNGSQSQILVLTLASNVGNLVSFSMKTVEAIRDLGDMFVLCCLTNCLNNARHQKVSN